MFTFCRYYDEDNFVVDNDEIDEALEDLIQLPKKKKYKKTRQIKVEDPVSDNNESLSVTCSTCGGKFQTLYDLTEHNQLEHQEDKDCLICPICSFEARGENSRKSIKGHIQRRHESAKIGKKLIVYIHLKKEPVTDRF